MTESRSRLVNALFALALLVVAFMAYRTAQAAQEAVLESESGSVAVASLDPSAPGFRAFTEPTAVAMVLHTAVSTDPGIGAELVGASLLVAAGEQAGGTVIGIPSTARLASSMTLSGLFETEGIDAVIAELESIFTVGFGEVVSLDAASWTALMAPELPLDVALREDLVAANGSVLVVAGEGPYALADVAAIAAHRNVDEEARSVSLRHQEIWKSWISRSARSQGSELPLVERGFIDVITSLAGGPVDYRLVPVLETEGVGAATSYDIDQDQIRDDVAVLIPFPESASPGARASALLLDGTGGQVDNGPVISAVASAGGQVAILGNTDAKTVEATRVEYHVEEAREVAERLAQTLPAGQPVENLLDASTVDLTVVIGLDQAS